jgi:hypothetical protein
MTYDAFLVELCERVPFLLHIHVSHYREGVHDIHLTCTEDVRYSTPITDAWLQYARTNIVDMIVADVTRLVAAAHVKQWLSIKAHGGYLGMCRYGDVLLIRPLEMDATDSRPPHALTLNDKTFVCDAIDHQTRVAWYRLKGEMAC